ncbi:MAG: BON domain-containing protein [Burkholderiales bacterium]|nr:BON domain-containing protein [Burkholderiales bacterium]
MKYTRAIAFAALTGILAITTGCAVSRGQETMGSYVDDASITAQVKAKFVGDHNVDATAIKVNTLNGTVQLSGFAKSAEEKDRAVSDARSVNGVRDVRDSILVRP